MKKFVLLLLSLNLFITACGQARAETVTSGATVQSPTRTPSPVLTNTSIPTETPTPSITPLPTIPTFTPTFDVSTIVTFTPALAERCPQSSSEAKLDTTPFYEHLKKFFDNQTFNFILEYLNSGGSWEIVRAELSNINKYGRTLGSINELDLTNDNNNELVVEMWAGFGIYSCRNGYYDLLLNLNGMVGEPASIVEIKDMNLNGIPEVVAGIAACSGHCFDMLIFEWDGREFQNLLSEWRTITSLNEEVLDVNNDRVFELVIEGPLPSIGGYIAYIPLRGQKDIYIWNGTNFSFSRLEFSPPEYRFQAIQDADIESLDKHFDKALVLYKDVNSTGKCNR